MKLIPDFVSRVSEVAKPEDTILVMCRSGGRSAIAVNMLAQAGFKHAYNITDGMERGSGCGSGQRFSGPAVGERLEELGLSLDVQPYPRTDGSSQSPVAGFAMILKPAVVLGSRIIRQYCRFGDAHHS